MNLTNINAAHMLTPIVVPTFVIVEHETTEHFALGLFIVATAKKNRLILCRASPVQKPTGQVFECSMALQRLLW